MLLKGRTALVTGVMGEVGRGAAYDVLAKEGAVITLVGRSSTKLQAIQAMLPKTTPSS
jgi:short-subunit dehydrogenase